MGIGDRFFLFFNRLHLVNRVQDDHLAGVRNESVNRVLLFTVFMTRLTSCFNQTYGDIIALRLSAFDQGQTGYRLY